MNWKERIVPYKNVLLGKPTIKGTRISVEFLLERLASGWTEEKILLSFPHLQKEDLQAVFSYLNDCVKDGLIVELRNKSALLSFWQMKISQDRVWHSYAKKI